MLPSEQKGGTDGSVGGAEAREGGGEAVAGLAARAVSLGGRLLIAPRAEVRGGTLAVIADPTGGAFALQKWPL